MEGGIALNQRIDHLLKWSEWGQQWVDYLRRKPQFSKELNRHANRFADAFDEVSRKAELLKEKPASEYEITRLTAKAEEIQRHFQELLRYVQVKSAETNGEIRMSVQRQGQPVPALRPVPIGGHKLPPLPYAYDALEPNIDAETMRIHHDKHHKSYVDGLNRAEMMLARARANNDYDLIKHWEREAAFNGAGHYLHTIFWQVMSPQGGGTPKGDLADEINRDFGSFAAFTRHFSQAAEKVEGGGWAILVWSPRAQHLEILTAEKHQNLTQWDVIPLLPLDVWEHAYYLTYRNDRAAYIDAWWNTVNWPHVQERFTEARRVRWQPY
jgi:Fe-Mn family superoxide dismutase